MTDPTARPAPDGAGLRALKADVQAARLRLIEAVWQAAAAGWSERRIAAELGVQRLTVRRWLDRV